MFLTVVSGFKFITYIFLHAQQRLEVQQKNDWCPERLKQQKKTTKKAMFSIQSPVLY